jgi:hypothetical protein
MCDLMEACAGAGLDSRQLRPIAHAMPDGRVAVYIGAEYQYLTPGKAMNLRDQLARAIDQVRTDAEKARLHGKPAGEFVVHDLQHSTEATS